VPWFSDNLHVERNEDSLVARSRRSIDRRINGALFCALGLIYLYLWVGISDATDAHDGPGYWLRIMLAIACVCANVLVMVPRIVTTVFDLRSQRILYHVDLAWGCYKRQHSYAFTEVSGVGIRKDLLDVTYMPVILKTDGGIMRLTSNSSDSVSHYANVIKAICAATGLAKVDVPRRRWWKFL
jgi:hypothetical protein